MDFQVVDGKNNPVKNLKSDDIEVYQDGKLQTINALSYISGGRAILRNTLEVTEARPTNRDSQISFPSSNGDRSLM